MNYEKLEKNIVDVIKEQQAKLGYMREKVRLYYPLSSLNHFFGTEEDAAGMMGILENFRVVVKDRLGDVKISGKDRRFCILIPLVREHGCTIGQIRELFEAYSDKVHFEKIDNAEFDYMLRFEDDPQDKYVYCFKNEGCHMTYHRFLPEDYEEFGF